MTQAPLLPLLNPNDSFHELGYPTPDTNTDMLDGDYLFIMQSVSEEVFPDDIETAQEVH